VPLNESRPLGGSTSMPLVSIVTPSFNQARWLADNLGSVAAQDYPRIEHLVRDGASTDESLEVLKKHASSSVSWSSAPDNGQSHAINLAFADAQGDIIGWLNSDDAYFGPETVSHVVRAFDEHPEADVVYGHAALVNAGGLILHALWAPPMWRPLLRTMDFITQPTVFVRRRVLAGLLVDPEFESMMDWELWLRLSRRHRFIRLNEILAIDRHQPNRKVITHPALASKDRRRLQEMYRVPPQRWSRPVVKVLTVAFRMVGTTLISALMAKPLAFDGHLDGVASVLLRQVATPRARMPFDMDRPASSG
jgi:glycosyltransferase involved in cell wall biosynthesis